MTPHQEQVLRISVVMFICIFGMYSTMFDVKRIHLLFRENIMYQPTTPRKLAVLAFLGGALFSAGAFVMIAP
jgi:hypothetical protein